MEVRGVVLKGCGAKGCGAKGGVLKGCGGKGCRGKGRTFFISAASRSEIRIGFESLNSMPLISEMPTAPFAKAPCTG